MKQSLRKWRKYVEFVMVTDCVCRYDEFNNMKYHKIVFEAGK